MNIDSDSYLAFFAEKAGYFVYRLRITPGGDPMVLYISGSVRSILGYDQEAFYNDSSLLLRIIASEDRAHLQMIEVRGGDCTYTLRLTSKDGTVRTIKTMNSVIRDEETGDLIVEGIGYDITGDRQREEEIRSRDRILKAVGYAASGFLLEGRWEDQIPDVIRRLGEAADASRAYLYLIEGMEDALNARLKWQWSVKGLVSVKPDTLDNSMYGEAFPFLLSGETIAGPVRDIGLFGELALKASPDIRSILIVPIAIHGRVSGFIGFDECRSDRIWADSQKQALEIAARIIGAAMERETDHQALADSESRLRSVFENAALGMVVAGPDFKVIDANPAFERMTGYSHDELIGLTFYDITHPDDISENRRGLTDLISGHISLYRIEKRYLRKGGDDLWVQAIITTIPLQNGPGYIAMVEDITWRRAAEQKLADSEEMHRSFLQHFHGIVYRSVEGDSVFIHGAIWEITGYLPDDIRAGKPSWSSLIHPDDSPDMMRRYDHLYATPGDKFDADYRIIRRDGAIRWVHEVIQHLTGSGGCSIIEAAIYDITRRHDIEEELALTNEKLNLLQSITRHDILNQVMALSAYMELLKEHVPDPAASKYLSGMEASIDRIQQISAFTHDYQTVGKNGPVWQDLGDVIRKGYQNRSPEKISLDCQIQGYEIYADPLLEKVFYNLVDNSSKYGREMVSLFRVTCSVDDGVFQILVEDDGPGIDPSIQHRLFEYGAGKGSGLGLFLIREILLITRIEINVSSCALGGAGFLIRVPPGGWRKGIYNTSPAS